MKFCFFGAYKEYYPRNTIIKKGLESQGAVILDCSLPPVFKFWIRYPLLLLKYLRFFRKHDFFFVPEFCQKDVPLAKFLSLLTGKKIIFDPLASRFETKIGDWKRKPPHSFSAWWNKKIDCMAFRLSDVILADTLFHRDYYLREYDISEEKIEVLPVGFDDEIFVLPSALPRRNKDSFSVLFYGSFLPLHGVDIIVKAAHELSSKDSSVDLRLVGSGQTLPLAKKLASELHLKNVCFEPWCPYRDLALKISSSDISLGIFGKTEKARRVVPHKIFQSMAMKIPVMTLRTPAAEEFFSHGENIYFCPEAQPEALAESILELKKDLGLRRKIAENGYHLVRENYSPEVIGQDLINIVKRKLSFFKNRENC